MSNLDFVVSQVIGGVELNAWLACTDDHLTSCLGRITFRHQRIVREGGRGRGGEGIGGQGGEGERQTELKIHFGARVKIALVLGPWFGSIQVVVVVTVSVGGEYLREPERDSEDREHILRMRSEESERGIRSKECSYLMNFSVPISEAGLITPVLSPSGSTGLYVLAPM